MKKPVILITGKNGQLGNELQQLSKQFLQFDYIFCDTTELDITNTELVDSFFEKNQPAVCINAAAYTAVDKAENDQERALQVNGEAVGNLAKNCAKINARLIHISTDYVFDGAATSPYLEDHPVDPVNFYGASKLKGEQLATQNLASTVVIRTSWVYSFFGNNFVKTMLRLMKERSTINVIDDQYGSPTYARDLAEAIMQMVVRNDIAGGIYHFSNEGNITWFQFAIAIRDLANLSCEVKAIDTSGYPTPAKRPGYSVMSKEKIKSIGIEIKDWKNSLAECIQLLMQK